MIRFFTTDGRSWYAREEALEIFEACVRGGAVIHCGAIPKSRIGWRVNGSQIVAWEEMDYDEDSEG